MYLYEQLVREAVTGSTLREIGAEIGVPATTIHDWIHLDKRPRLDTLPRIAEWAKLPVLALLLDASSSRDEQTIISLLPKLTPDQKRQIALQMKFLLHTDAAGT